jgi:hypothetical protein
MEFLEDAAVRLAGVCVCPWRLLHFNQKRERKKTKKIILISLAWDLHHIQRILTSKSFLPSLNLHPGGSSRRITSICASLTPDRKQLSCRGQRDLQFEGILDRFSLSVVTFQNSDNELNGDHNACVVKQDLHHNRQKCTVCWDALKPLI